MHRWVWDLRPTGGAGGRAGRGGPPSPAATAGQAGGGRGGGALAQPGTYTVKLTVDGKSFTQPLVVKPDPRLK